MMEHFIRFFVLNNSSGIIVKRNKNEWYLQTRSKKNMRTRKSKKKKKNRQGFATYFLTYKPFISIFDICAFAVIKVTSRRI